MKKLLYILPVLLFLTGCAAASSEKRIDSVLSDLGVADVHKDVNVTINKKHGALDIAITNVKTATITVDDEASHIANNKKMIDAVAIKWTIKNTSKNVTQFNELASYIVTKDGQQINGTTFDSRSIDFELHPGVKKTGELYFIMDNPVDDLTEFTLYIDDVLIDDKVVTSKTKVKVKFK